MKTLFEELFAIIRESGVFRNWEGYLGSRTLASQEMTLYPEGPFLPLRNTHDRTVLGMLSVHLGVHSR